MRPFLFFDFGGTLVYDASREDRFRVFWSRCGQDLAEQDVARAFHRADRHFMEHAPVLWRAGNRLLQEAHLARVADELGLMPRAGALEALAEEGRPAWQPYPDSVPALLLFHALGYSCGLITNWDYTARDAVARSGLDGLLAPVVVSSEVGAEKPERMIFDLALDAAGVAPQDAVYVGDNYWADVAGAREAGIRAVLVDRHPEWSPAAPCETANDLWDLVRLVTLRPAVDGRRA